MRIHMVSLIPYGSQRLVDLMNSLYFHISVDYIITHLHWVSTASAHLSVLPFGIVVEPSSVRGLAADYPLLQCLGFNLAPSILFFLLSSPSRLRIFHRYVVVSIALGTSSNSIDFG